MTTVETPLAKFKAICHKYMVISDDSYIDVIVGAIMANRLDSSPVWLYVVAPPGGGKTEILNAFEAAPGIYSLSTLTSQTLISGKIQDGPFEADPSLLPRLDGKVMIIKDFTPLLSGRREVLMEICGQLRDAYDGTCRKAFGTGKDTPYKAKFGVIAAVTNEIDNHRGILSDLGERFLTLRLPPVSDSEERERCRRACSNPASVQKKELSALAKELLATRPSLARMPDEIREEIINIAVFAAKARCHVHRDRETREPDIPIPEIATRLTRQLTDLAVGIAPARSTDTRTSDEALLASKVGLDGLTQKRIWTLRGLLSHHPNSLTTAMLASSLGASVTTMQSWLEELELLKLVKNITPPGPERYYKQAFKWTLKDADLLQRVWGTSNDSSTTQEECVLTQCTPRTGTEKEV